MTHLITVLADRWPRCPECGSVAYPSWATQHRPGCAYTHVPETEWSSTHD